MFRDICISPFQVIKLTTFERFLIYRMCIVIKSFGVLNYMYFKGVLFQHIFSSETLTGTKKEMIIQ
jgi:hypothetical protein